MSSVRPTPPPTDTQTNHVNGFNDHAYYDPFFAAPNDDEQLVQISSHTSPDSQFYSTASSPPSKTSRNTSAAPETQDQFNHQPYNYSQPNGLHASNTPPHSLINGHGVNSTHNFLSPKAGLTSDNTYDLSDHSGTPELAEDFYLEADFGYLANPENEVDLSQWSEQSGTYSPEAPSNHDYQSLQPTRHQPASSGAATLVSHLMSPVLTDNASPGSRDGRGSPTMDQPPDRAGAYEHNTTAAFIRTEDHSRKSSNSYGQVLQTPTLTGSSIDTSPERPTAAAIHRAPSPVVRIESYSRGDSPQRPAGLLGRSASKRSRSSSHLAVEHDDASSDEDDEREDRHGSGPTVMPEDPRTGRSPSSGRAGLNPEARQQVGDAEVPNLRQQEESEQMALKIADVHDWLAHSETGSDAGGNLSPPPKRKTVRRRRARSTGDQSLTYANLMSLRDDPLSNANIHIPGPGLVINEDSGEEEWDTSENDEKEEEDLPESPPATLGTEDPTGQVSAHDQYASPPPLYRARVWQDPLYDSTDPGPDVKIQPLTSNEAMMRFNQRAVDLETMSRAATWGTRRLSESDLEGLFHRLSFKHDEGKEKSERRGSFFEQAAAKLLPKRNQSLLRRKESEASKQQAHRPSVSEHKKMDSFGSRKERETLGVPVPPQRRPSLGKRPKSPRINTGSAVAAMAGQIAAVGAGVSGPATATATSSPTPWTSAKMAMKRSRSRSDLQGNTSTTNLGDLWTKQGGPPMPTLAAPPGTPPKSEEKLAPFHDVGDMDEDEDEDVEDKGVTIDLSIRADPIVPTMDGFRSNVRQLNPRLPPFLVERIAQEQLRRYKKLIDFKVKHAQALSTGKCPSQKHCTELGGEPTYLPSKATTKEADLSHTGFSIAGLGQSDDDANALAEGIVTPAQFPPGVPMPPVKRLPAEFECSLCFKVKKFHKPSDWSKHVHEDVQPFTCTFQSCAEPKSFKRKADWVRHENERHRQLEWWMCNMHDCSHKCYRKDNFVQHLVREHKLPEPKVKTAKAGKPAVRGPSSQKARANRGDGDDSPDEFDQVWRLVEECRHETPKNPKDEPCKFCGNICNSWKKLTVHLAKHMEQISMPVLNVAKAKEVTPETIISPIEQRTQNTSNSPVGQTPFNQNPPLPASLHPSLSPFGSMSGNSVTPMPDLPGSFTPMQAQAGYYDGQGTSQFQRSQASTYPPPVPQPPNPNYSSNRGSPYNMSAYGTYDSGSTGSQFVPVNAQNQRSQLRYANSSSPENLYPSSSMGPPPTSQPRPTAFMNQHQQHRSYPSTDTYPQQRQFVSPAAERYGFRSNNSPPIVTFAPSSQAMGAQAPLAYGQIQDLSYSQAPGDASMYGMHDPGRGRGQGPGYGY